MMNVNDELDTLTAAAEVAREAEDAARAAIVEARSAVADRRGELTQAHAGGDQEAIKKAHAALERAERAAGGSALGARLDGSREAVRRAELAVGTFKAEHYVELIGELRPQAEQCVAEIRRCADALAASIAGWSTIDQAVGRITRDLQWWDVRSRMPRGDQFDGLVSALDELRLSTIAPPMPNDLGHPDELQTRAEGERAEQNAGRAASVDPAAIWAA